MARKTDRVGSLDEYRRMRDFATTPEPSGDEANGRGGAEPGLAFVVQKHAASRLHYDFRLELDGVLKSWAVPKGPDLDPKERRLAVHVEDHPIPYGEFEGVIPQGQYGGGTVLLWDRGRWLPRGGEAQARRDYRRGKLHFDLEGEKLRGGWVLVRTAAEGGKNWLLFKEDDAEARSGEGDWLVRTRPESVASGRDLPQIAAAPERVWHSNRADRPTSRDLDPSALPRARKARLPRELAPQLATLTDRVPAGEDWLHEIKHDGYRALCRIEGRDGEPDVALLTRRGNDWTERFAPVAAAAALLPVGSALLDGEVVALAPDGTSSFSRLQQTLGRSGGAGGDLVYFVFDLLHLDGHDLTRAPLTERKRLLAELLELAPGTVLRLSEHVAGRGEAFLEHACRFALEGVVSKRAAAPYTSGRGRDWLKTKCSERQEFVIGGYTDPSGARTGVGSLLLGAYPPGAAGEPGAKLVYLGRVGTGFDAAMLAELAERFAALATDDSPFEDPRHAARAGRGGRPVHWVRPELVCEVSFSEWTHDGVLRHSSFQGLREDKDPDEVVREVPQAGRAGAAAGDGNAGGADPAPDSAEGRKERAMAKTVSRATTGKAAGKGGKGRKAIEVAGVRITNPDRVLYPEQGVTKADLAAYYERVSEHMLPHLAGRPLTLVRCPSGRTGQCFFQKHLDESFPQAVKRREVAEREGSSVYGLADDLPALLALVQMGVLELHVWGARVDRIERPDTLVFDLDPEEGLPWARVVEATLALRERLEGLGLASFVKTTGGKGLHVVVPIQRRTEWDDAKAFARAVAEDLVRKDPERYTANMAKAKRHGRVFLDYLRNGRGATYVTAYSTRARAGAPVSVPIGWDEVATTAPNQYTVENLPARLAKRRRDPWEGYFDVRQSITKPMRRELGLR
ncbi:MAG TPA: DNA ligase D [Thermoanaerobaculia bacterium]|nr:DNA ligase D [Thermoanaerobaculia bacterium]